MKRLALLVLTLAAPVAAKPMPVHSSDYHPNPKFHAVHRSPLAATAQGGVEQLGEIAIVEGDATLVSDNGQGGFGIDSGQGNQASIAQRFYGSYEDAFDEIIIFTTFDDTASQGALAYEMSAQQDVRGIGQQQFDESSSVWGAGSNGLHAFVNMKRWNQYEEFDGLKVTDPRSNLYSTLGQEFAHRWLSFFHYVDRTGKVSDALLGRSLAHWASTLQADASVMDGNQLVDEGGGSFLVADSFARFSPLDLYGMGLLPAREVPPFFRVNNATQTDGSPVDPTQYLRVGARIFGDREDVSIGQVLAAEGPRMPSWDRSAHGFRVAFVLVTRPGESAGAVTDVARSLDQVRLVWEQRFAEYTAYRGTMCTQLDAPCGSPTAKVVGGRLTEAGGNHNGVVDPGEPALITITLHNDGPSPAEGIGVTVSSDRIRITQGSVKLADRLLPGRDVDVTVTGTIPTDAPCGQPIYVRAEATAGGNTFRGFVSVIPGLTDAFARRFDLDAGLFGVNLDGKDTAAKNGWEYGSPLEYHGLHGYQFQPGQGHDGASRMWFTGLSRGHRLRQDSSLGVGKSTLWSPPIDVSRVYLPTLRYFLWFQAVDFSHPSQGGTANGRIYFTVDGSLDGGRSWVELDRVGGDESTIWQQRDIDLGKKLAFGPGSQLILRFTATNPENPIDQLVEAGIDEVRVLTQSQACNPNAATAGRGPLDGAAPAAGGCSIGRAKASDAGLALLALALLAAFALRRR